MYESLYFDLAAGLVLFTIIISLQFRQITKGTTNKVFLSLTWFCFAASILDLLRFLFDGDPSIPNWIRMVLTILFLSMRNISFAAYCFYVVSITDMWHRAQSKIQVIIMPIPFYITLLFSLYAIVSKTPFYFDLNGYFISGKGMWVFYLCNEIYGIYAVISIFVYRKFLGKRKTVALLSTVAAYLGSYLISQVFPQFHMDMILYSLGLLFVMIVVQNPEVRIDYQSGLARHSTYYYEMARGFESEKPMTVIMIDIRNYREISHMLSYSRLTDFIKYLSSRMLIINEKLKSRAELYYLKDGKFRVVMSDMNPSKAIQAAETYHKLFTDEVKLDDLTITISSIVCIARCPDNFEDLNSFQDFENTMQGYDDHNQVVTAAEVLANDDFNVVRHMDSIIEKGLMEGGFEVYYQPIFDVKTGKFNSAEALLRLYDKRFGFIYPDIFVQAAEKNGSIHRLGELVLNQVCKFISSEEFDGLGVDYISINISVFQCLKADFPDKVKSIINRNNVSPQKICFEIRESLATDSQKVFIDNIEELKNFGIQFALDDYGTGYSNITTFANNSLGVIKLDKSFVNAQKNERLNAVLLNTIEMVKALGKSIVIEGVETKEVADRFIGYGCDKIQGFIYSNAVTESEFIDFIKGQN